MLKRRSESSRLKEERHVKRSNERENTLANLRDLSLRIAMTHPQFQVRMMRIVMKKRISASTKWSNCIPLMHPNQQPTLTMPNPMRMKIIQIKKAKMRTDISKEHSNYISKVHKVHTIKNQCISHAY